MAANTIYITAGLPVAKDSGQSPTSQVNTVYVTAGLPPVVEVAGAAGQPTMRRWGGVPHMLPGPVLAGRSW